MGFIAVSNPKNRTTATAKTIATSKRMRRGTEDAGKSKRTYTVAKRNPKIVGGSSNISQIALPLIHQS